MYESNNRFDLDFHPIEQATKKSREARGKTREHLSELTRYVAAIEQSIHAVCTNFLPTFHSLSVFRN